MTKQHKRHLVLVLVGTAIVLWTQAAVASDTRQIIPAQSKQQTVEPKVMQRVYEKAKTPHTGALDPRAQGVSVRPQGQSPSSSHCSARTPKSRKSTLSLASRSAGRGIGRGSCPVPSLAR